MPRLVTANLDIHYESCGKGEPVLLLHGLGSSGLDWEYQIDALALHYQTITVDFRGHGQSWKPAGRYSVPLFAADIIELIETLKLPPAHLVGLSMGGMVAFQLAIDAPQLVKSLVIINSGPELILRTLSERMMFLQRTLIVRTLGIKHLASFLGKLLLPEPHQQQRQSTLIQRWSKNDKAAYLKSLRALIGWSVTNQLDQIACPALVVSADQDYTPVSFKQAYLTKMPRAELAVIHDSRHLSPIDQPDQVNEAILAFLTKLDNS